MSNYGIDTNVLIRYFVQDDPEQASKATEFLEANCTEESPGHVALVVLCEIVWVLRRAYKYPKEEIIPVLESLLTASELSIEQAATVWEALRNYEQGNADFADYLIGSVNRNAGCLQTVTFDRIAADSADFFLLD